MALIDCLWCEWLSVHRMGHTAQISSTLLSTKVRTKVFIYIIFILRNLSYCNSNLELGYDQIKVNAVESLSLGIWTLVCVCVCVCVLSHVQLFATPWNVARQDPLFMDYPATRILERVAISSSRGSSQLRDQTSISCSSCIEMMDSLPLSHLESPWDIIGTSLSNSSRNIWGFDI